jgi:energy-coupling factor transport system ATP-binding protein
MGDRSIPAGWQNQVMPPGSPSVRRAGSLQPNELAQAAVMAALCAAIAIIAVVVPLPS